MQLPGPFGGGNLRYAKLAQMYLTKINLVRMLSDRQKITKKLSPWKSLHCLNKYCGLILASDCCWTGRIFLPGHGVGLAGYSWRALATCTTDTTTRGWWQLLKVVYSRRAYNPSCVLEPAILPHQGAVIFNLLKRYFDHTIKFVQN